MVDPEDKVKKVSGLMLAGVAALVSSVGLFIFSLFLPFVAPQVLAILLFPVGLILCAIALASGWRDAFGDPSKHPVQKALDIYVVAKIALDENGDNVLDMGAHDPAELQYLVQVRMPGGRVREFEAAYPVFCQVGEGMNGDILFQGRWLSQFTFKPKHDPIDPYTPS